jgi:O-acetylhomoserine/O-acetylserine sulfhydrylase-like pyridoxal-dependent enzyme
MLHLQNRRPLKYLDNLQLSFKCDRAGVVESLLRLSVGIEDIEDLIEDLKQVLN